MDLSNRVAVVTGAGGVLCSLFAKELASLGASVALLDINYDAVCAVAADITAAGGRAKGYKADVLSIESLKEAKALIDADFGACSVLVNGAGGNNPRATTDDEFYSAESEGMKSFFDLDGDGIDFVFKLNFSGVLLPTQVFAKDMTAMKEAAIVNVSSMNAFTPLTKIPAYSGAKSAVSNFTQWLAVYFSKTGIRVNAIAPGFFVTNQNRALLMDADGTLKPRASKILAGTPMGRFGEPEELLGALRFLIDSEAASFVTGVVIPVDGGFSSYAI